MIYSHTFDTAQEDATIITPSSGKKLYVWRVLISGTNIEVGFLTSERRVDQWPSLIIDIQGAVDEVLSISCDANTTVTVMYDEL